MDFVSIGVPEKVKQDFRELKAEVEKRQSTDSPVSASFSDGEFLSVLMVVYRAHCLRLDLRKRERTA